MQLLSAVGLLHYLFLTIRGNEIANGIDSLKELISRCGLTINQECNEAKYLLTLQRRVLEHQHLLDSPSITLDDSGRHVSDIVRLNSIEYEVFFRQYVMSARAVVISDPLITETILNGVTADLLDACLALGLAGEFVSIPQQCPGLLDLIRIPPYAVNDYWQRLPPGERRTPRWPALIRGAENSLQRLGSCPFGMHQTIAVLQGELEVSIVEESSKPFLYPQYHTPDRGGISYEANPFLPDALTVWPLLRRAKRADGRVVTGDYLFVPGGSVPTWLYAKESVLFSQCFIDAFNINSVLEELQLLMLVDEGAVDLARILRVSTEQAQMVRSPSFVPWAEFVAWPREEVVEDGKQQRYKEWQAERKWQRLIATLSVPAPPAPLVLNVGRFNATVAWQAGPHAVIGYQLTCISALDEMEECPSLDISRSSLASGDMVDGVVTATMSGLRSGVEYFFYVTPQTENGPGPRSSASLRAHTISVRAPGAMSVPTVVGGALSALHVHFNAPEDAGGMPLQGFVFERKVLPPQEFDAFGVAGQAGDNGWIFSGQASPQERVLQISGLTPGNRYQVRSAAFNEIGRGNWSVESEAVWTASVNSEVPRGSKPGKASITVTGAGARESEEVCPGPVVTLSDSSETLLIQLHGTLVRLDVWSSLHSPRAFDIQAQVACAIPETACVPLGNGRDVRDRILLVRRGDCAIHTKAVVARASGAIGLVVLDTGECDEGFNEHCMWGANKSRGEGFANSDAAELWATMNLPVVIAQQSATGLLQSHCSSAQIERASSTPNLTQETT